MIAPSKAVSYFSFQQFHEMIETVIIFLNSSLFSLLYKLLRVKAIKIFKKLNN